MIVDIYRLRWYADEFRAVADYFARNFTKTVISGFSDIEEEADAIQQETLRKLLSSWSGPDDDPEAPYEFAWEAGGSFYLMAHGIRQGTINLYTVGLYHLFEQWLLMFHRRELLWPPDRESKNTLELAYVKKMLIKHYKIDLDSIESWPKIDELRLVANTVKHADGTACTKLKELRPDLFVSPHSEKDSISLPLAEVTRVYTPLAGNNFYITPEQFIEYVEAVKKFWGELLSKFDALSES